MRLDRMIGILTILQQNGRTTAPALADRFEVSRRTIQRDVDALCQAGIPIVTMQGTGGGIALMEGYALNSARFTREEIGAILTGLKSLDSVLQSPGTGKIALQLGADADDTFSLDLSSFYRDDLADKIGRIRQAIGQRKCIQFLYYYDKGEKTKVIEPCQIIYRWSDWYVFGFCRDRQDFRLYKLRRAWDLRISDMTFLPRALPDNTFDSHMTDDYMVSALLDPQVKYRLVEEYGPHCFTVHEDGRLLMKRGFTTPQKALDWLIAFGAKVQVLDPPELVERIQQEIQKMAHLYTKHDI